MSVAAKILQNTVPHHKVALDLKTHNEYRIPSNRSSRLVLEQYCQNPGYIGDPAYFETRIVLELTTRFTSF